LANPSGAVGTQLRRLTLLDIGISQKRDSVKTFLTPKVKF
jgi:hypothetical protein